MSKSIEEKRRYFKDSIYLKYENQKNISKEQFIDESQNKKHKLLIKLQRVAAIIIVFAVGMSVYAGVTGNLNLNGLGLLKINQNYESSKVDINKSIENEYCKITLESMAGDSSYIVAQYKIELTEKAINQFDEITQNEFGDYDFGFNSTIYIDSKEILHNVPYIEKISDTEYIATEIIDIIDLDRNKFNLEIDLENLYVGTYPGYGNNRAEIQKKIQVEVNLNEIIKNEVVAEQQIDENTQIVVEKVANTKFQTFIKVKEIRKNLKWSDYNSMQYTSFLITDENDTQIQCVVYGGHLTNETIYVHGDNEIKSKYRVEDTDIVDLEEEYLILVGLENIDKIKLIPTTNWCYNGAREVKIYNEKTWYPIIPGDKKYFETDNLGGIVEVNKIEVDDENITFYYEETGLIGINTRVIIREKDRRNSEIQYMYPIKTEIKGINGDENKSIFSRTKSGAGAGIYHLPYDDISDLEFTLLYGTKTDRIGETIEINIPSLNENIAEFKNIEITDINPKDKKEYPNMSSKYTSKEDLPEDYTKEQAIKDGCIVIENGEIVSEDKNAL